MVLFIESIIGIVLFTCIVVPMSATNPIGVIYDYPPAIRNRCKELGLIENTEKRFTLKDLIVKGLAIIVLMALMVFVLIKVNHVESFWQGFLSSFVIWLAITWFDAIVIDCIWFCHSKRMRIPGTEDMKEYKDYLFHIKQSCIGTLIGILACVIVGLFVFLLS